MARRPTILAVSVAGLAGLAPAAARAADTWTTPYVGVRHLHRTTATPWNIHALQIDLCAPGVKLRATATGERQKTVSTFAKLVGAEAAVNGDFFSYATYSTSGLAIGNGVRWTGTSDSSSETFLAFGPQMADLPDATQVVSAPPAWMDHVVSGRPQLLKDGQAVPSTSPREPRTAAGMSKDRRTLWLAVVDGRSTRSAGMTFAELATLLKGLGAYDAVNLDGGGSTTMWLKGPGVVNVPSDGSERVVANHLAIEATGTGAPGSCVPLAPPPDLAPPVVADAGEADGGEGPPDGAMLPEGDGGEVAAPMGGGCSAAGRAPAPLPLALALLLGGMLGGILIRRARRSRVTARA